MSHGEKGVQGCDQESRTYKGGETGGLLWEIA